MGRAMSLRVVGAKEAAWWAEELYRDRVPADWEVPEPDCWEAARAAVERFRELDADSGVNRRAAVGSRRAAKGVSTDWLQGVSEVVQNAEDLGATEVRLQVADGVLRLAHNGRPVRLRDVIPLSMPWLSGKSDDAESVGRFGIGLMSLFRFAPQFDLYSGIYRLRIGEEGLDHASDRPALSVFGPGEWTVFHVPLTREVVAAGARRTLTAEALEEWLTAWGHEALLFLRHVAAVVLVDGEGRLLRRLTLRRTAVEGFGAEVASERAAVEATDVRAPGGRGWRVFHAVVASPPGLEPEGKPVGEVTPLAVACPWTPGSARPADRETHQVGYVHARLPVAPFPLPVRLHAAFDPVPSRQDLQDTSWNLALGQRLADLWAAVVLEQFRADPAACWSLLPLPRHTTEVDQRGAVSALAEALMERSRHQVGVRLRIGVPDRGMYPLEDLAVEDPELTRLLTEAEIERLADHPVLPAAARDTDGVYREVLKDWTDHGYLAPVRVSLRDAQQLLGDTERSVEATVSLAAACLDTVWGIFMDDFPWIADTAGARHRPLRSQELRLFADRPGSLAEKLGFARVLHPEFLTDSPAAARVRAWLTEHNALLVDDDELTALRRLAGYGQNLTARPTAPALRLTDEQVCLLKAAFARLEDADRRRLGEDLGRAVALPAYEYLPDGRRQESWAAIASVYLPAGVDRTERTEGFPFAAARTPGLFWLRPRCVTVLRESGPGLGPLEFLRELGAASTPRTMLHRRRELRLHQLGLPAGAPGSRARTLQMLSLGAQYTLGDREAPDLDAVACDIAAEPDGAVRRKRAAALLHVLGRAWEARYARDTQIIAAEAHRKWYTMGKVPAFWLWRLRDEIAWLDSEHGTPVRPAQLRRRTEATALVYGADAGKVLHPEIQKAVERREPVLKALKVGGEPTTADIVERLRQLRSAELDGEPADVPAAMLLYRVLAGRTIPPRAPDGDLSRADLIKAFAEGPGLVRTETGWHTPASCLRGKPIFDSFREFAPPVANGDALWEMLGVPAPSADDAIAVIRELSRVAPDTSGSQLDAEGQSVVLQSLQLLQTYAAGDPDALKGRPLRRLPLWTDRGWARRRPVYALADETMAGQLGTVLSASGHAGAVWRPGTDLEHVGDIAARLGVTILGPDSMMPRVDTPHVRIPMPRPGSPRQWPTCARTSSAATRSPPGNSPARGKT